MPGLRVPTRLSWIRGCALALLAMCAAPTLAGGTVLPAGAKVGGHSQAEWSQLWWQWAASFNDFESPVADRTGARCAARQDGPVWFLAGTYGTRRTIRTCKIPSGKYLFFPLINYVVMPTSGLSISCEAAVRTAASTTDGATSLILEIDGVRTEGLETHRQPTKSCFDVAALSTTGAHLYPSAANGYYAMLKPLSPGKHVLNFGGALPDMLQAVTYTLEVE